MTVLQSLGQTVLTIPSLVTALLTALRSTTEVNRLAGVSAMLNIGPAGILGSEELLIGLQVCHCLGRVFEYWFF